MSNRADWAAGVEDCEKLALAWAERAAKDGDRAGAVALEAAAKAMRGLVDNEVTRKIRRPRLAGRDAA